MDEDQQAIKDCQLGKTESYRILVEKYKTRAFYAALLITGNREDALDLSQEAFFKAFRAIKTFQTGRSFYTWYYKILKNLCINHYKRVKRRNVVFSDADELGSGRPSLYLSSTANPAELFEKNEMRDLLWKGLMQLKKEDREIIILKEFQELSYKEISEILTIPVGSVMSRLFYARKKLASLMEDLT
jgi:RNA polymerase sigma-70 factor (ECF subfamily)